MILSIQIKIVNRSHHPLPAYQTGGAAGMDLMAFTEQPLTLAQNKPVLVSTGLYISLPAGVEAQVRPRSGLALKHSVTVLNSPGTIDCDYRGEIKVLLINFSNQNFYVHDGDRIAQLVVASYLKTAWVQVSELTPTDRNEAGYGSTGVSS